jgi:hypothetical protein
MKARRLDEVLDECLSAYLEGRRTIEESLSLYPSLRDELEPLLRTAIPIADTFNESAPPDRVQERGRQEFLTSASVRQRAKLLTKDISFGRRLAGAAGRRRWLLLAAAVVTVGIAAAAAVTAVLDLSDSQPNAASLPASPLTPTVGHLRESQQQLWRRANQGVDVSPEMIRSLSRATAALQLEVGDFSALDSGSRLELERAIADQYLLLHLIVNTQPVGVAPEARQALGITEQVAQNWGVNLPEVPPGLQAEQTSTPIQATAETATAPSPTSAPDTPAGGPDTTLPPASSVAP